VSSGKQVILANGAQAKNIFWQVGSNVEIGTGAHVNGNILAQTAINLRTGASLNGRMLAQTAVTLDANAVTMP
jgi:cytoskeletal protein CcmA (bactofilin family)